MNVKVCGLCHAPNISQIAELAPDYMGFIFYEHSPRFAGMLLPETLEVISPTTRRVGVFVDAPIKYIRSTISRYGLDFVQLHGEESIEICRDLKRDIGVIKAFGISNEEDFRQTADYEGVCDYFLFDTKTPAHGGSGHSFDHGLLKAYNESTPYLLSGGLSPEDAKRLAGFEDKRCIGFDINSRFETEVGLKSPAAVKIFLDVIKKTKNEQNR